MGLLKIYSPLSEILANPFSFILSFFFFFLIWLGSPLKSPKTDVALVVLFFSLFSKINGKNCFYEISSPAVTSETHFQWTVNGNKNALMSCFHSFPFEHSISVHSSFHADDAALGVAVRFAALLYTSTGSKQRPGREPTTSISPNLS